jgi:hypothetical protein
MATLLALISGIRTAIATITTSAGAADAGKVPTTNSAGVIDTTLIPSIPSTKISDSTAVGRSVLAAADAAAGRSALSLGTIATQNSNSVAITGGAIDGTAIGSTTASSGKFTTTAASTSVAVDPGTNLKSLLENQALRFSRSSDAAYVAYISHDGAQTINYNSRNSHAFTGNGATVPLLYLTFAGTSSAQLSVGLNRGAVVGQSTFHVQGNQTIGSAYGASTSIPANSLAVQGKVLIGTTTDDGASSLIVANNAAIAGTLKVGSYTTATLPAAGTAGREAYATDARWSGGTGCVVRDDGSIWVTPDGVQASITGYQRTLTANRILDRTDRIIWANASGITITLPAVSTNKFVPYRIRNISAGAVTIAASGTDLVEGAASISLAAGNSYDFENDGVSAWRIM